MKGKRVYPLSEDLHDLIKGLYLLQILQKKEDEARKKQKHVLRHMCNMIDQMVLIQGKSKCESK